MKSEILSLYRLSRELLALGADGTPVYIDEFARLNREVWTQAGRLSALQGSTPDEEAFLCLTLLTAYDATLYDNGDKGDRIRRLLCRVRSVLDALSPSLLKVRLLVRCYGFVFDASLASQARRIIGSWDASALTPEQREVVRELEAFEAAAGEWEEVESDN